MTLQEERNQLAKDILIHQQRCNAKEAFIESGNLMGWLYGKAWARCVDEELGRKSPVISEKTPIVSVFELNGQKGVRLCVGDVDMFIEAHDLDDGKEYEWPDAMKRLKEVGKETFSHKQGLLMAAYRDEINAALREIGGDELKVFYWTSTEYTTYYAWLVYFTNGSVYYYGKYNSLAVRACAAFKH